MASFASMSDVELRRKLVEFGFDIPVAGNRDFIIKKLTKLQEGRGTPKGGKGPGRKSSTPVRPPLPPPPVAAMSTNSSNSSTSNSTVNNGRGTPRPNSRLSVNDSGQRRSVSRESDRLLLPPTGASGGSRRSVGSAVETSSNKSNSSATSRKSLPAGVSSGYSNSNSSRLRQVQEETVEEDEEEESSSEDDSILETLESSSMNGDHNNHEDDEEEEEVIHGRPLSTFKRQPTTPSRNTSYTRSTTGTTASNSSSSLFSTKTIPRGNAGSGSSGTSFYSANNTLNNSSASASATTPVGTSSRFEKYYNYFRSNNGGDSRNQGDPLLYSSRSFVSTSPSSTAGNWGSPSFTNRSYGSSNTSLRSEDCSADEEDEDEFETEGESKGEGRTRKLLRKINPLNLVSGVASIWSSWTPSWGKKDTETDLTVNRSSSMPRTFSQQQQQQQTLGTSNFNNSNSRFQTLSPMRGIPVGGPASAAVARHLYCPSPGVPPAVAEGRQAGFRMFSSRESSGGTGNERSWDGTAISKAILISLFMLFGAIAVGYYVKSLGVNSNNVKMSGDGISKTITNDNSNPGKKSTMKAQHKRDGNVQNKFCVCEDNKDVPKCLECIPKDFARGSKNLSDFLKIELVQRAKWKGCNEDDNKLNFVSAKIVGAKLMGLKQKEVEPFFRGALILITENPSWGLTIIPPGESHEESELNSTAVLALDPETSFIMAQGVEASTLCDIVATFYSLVFYLISFTILAAMAYVAYWVIKKMQSRKKEMEKEIFETVQEVIEMLRDQQERSKANSSIDGYLAINHIRDTLIAPQDRKKKEGLWKEVVNHISTQESRVREEVQHISGEEYQVWRWMAEASPLPSPIMSHRRKSFAPAAAGVSPGGSGDAPASFSTPNNNPRLYPSLDSIANDLNNLTANGEDSLWQGQAFEVNAGSPNALMKIPSTCLKIRQMYDPARGIDDERRALIGRSIQQKCGGSRILHVGIDAKTADGSVYLLCGSKEDARAAFSALHGWWFEGNLLSVKFLREERYFERFPDAIFLTIPNSMMSGGQGGGGGGFRDQLRTSFINK